MSKFLSPPEGGLPPIRVRRTGLAATFITIILLVAAGTASASIVQLPPGAQVNDDLAANIDKAQDAGLSDVVGGSLTAGINVPWATFEQKHGTSQQIFVRSFAGGAWKTRGPSLNIDLAKEAEAPSIDFAGANRTVPWVSWYEPNDNLPGGKTNIFASRFDSTAEHLVPRGPEPHRSPGRQGPVAEHPHRP